MSDHLDLDTLADLLAGEGPPATAEAEAHLAGCSRCSAALADLDAALPGVDALLRAEAARPLPPVPADLLPRLLSALPPGAGEAGPRSTGTSAGTGDGAGSTVLPGTVTPLRQRPARSRRVLGVAAAGVALLALAGVGLGVSRGGDGDDGASTAVASAPAADLPVLASGTDYTDATSVAAALPLLLGTAQKAAGSAAGAAPDARAAAPLADAPRPGGTTGGTTGGAGTVAGSGGAGTAQDSESSEGSGSSQDSGGGTAAGGTALGAPAAPAPAAAAAPAAVPDPLARLRDPAELAGCLGELTGPDVDVVPLALDYASYRGQPALAVVLPSARADKVDVFVVGAACRAGDDRTLFFTRQQRP